MKQQKIKLILKSLETYKHGLSVKELASKLESVGVESTNLEGSLYTIMKELVKEKKVMKTIRNTNGAFKYKINENIS